MTEAVLDASVVLKWFPGDGERHADAALGLRALFGGGKLAVIAPNLLWLEVINVAGRQWHYEESALVRLVERLEGMGFAFADPDVRDVARWTGRGLTAYDATYVALAEAHAVPLITDDDGLVAAAPGVATPLAAWTPA